MNAIKYQAPQKPKYDLQAFGKALDIVFAATYKDVPNAKDMYSSASRQASRQKAA